MLTTNTNQRRAWLRPLFLLLLLTLVVSAHYYSHRHLTWPSHLIKTMMVVVRGVPLLIYFAWYGSFPDATEGGMTEPDEAQFVSD